MFRIASLIIYSTLILAGLGLFKIKAMVHNMQLQYAEIKKQIEQEHSSINLLKANFSYLTKPDRLRLLAEKYLELKNVSLAQISYDAVDAKTKISKSLNKFNMAKTQKSGNWRYKKVKFSTKTVSVPEKKSKKR